MGRTIIAAYASAAYLKAHGTPKKLADLSKHKLISPFARGETPMVDWPLLNGKRVRIKPHLTGNTMTFLRDAAVAGLGIVLIPEALATPALERVLPKQIGQVTPVAIVFQEKELMAPAVRALIDFIVANHPVERIARGSHAFVASQPR